MENQNGRTLFDLDEVDLQIVRCLQEDGRTSNSEIARQIGVSEPTVRKRIERLRQSGLIKIVAILNPRKSGYYAQAMVGIRTEPGRAQDVGEQLAQLTEVVYVGYITGRFDLLVEVMLKNEDELFEWLTRRLYGFAGIATTETFYILRTAKINYDWKLAPERFEEIKEHVRKGGKEKGDLEGQGAQSKGESDT